MVKFINDGVAEQVECGRLQISWAQAPRGFKSYRRLMSKCLVCIWLVVASLIYFLPDGMGFLFAIPAIRATVVILSKDDLNKPCDPWDAYP